jgi:hypothetical protein
MTFIPLKRVMKRPKGGYTNRLAVSQLLLAKNSCSFLNVDSESVARFAE